MSCNHLRRLKPHIEVQRVKVPPGKAGHQPEASLAWRPGNRRGEALDSERAGRGNEPRKG
jgi:hypothetical protein